jgi:hypothetical protein
LIGIAFLGFDDAESVHGSNNGTTDIDLRFGTRITVSGVAVDTLKCDGTTLSRGGIKCP